jgi:hypothetical protein
MDIDKGFKEGSLKFTLYGTRLKGNWALAQVRNKEDDDKENWLLIKEKDDYALPDSGIEKYNTSIRTGRTMEEIEEGREAGGLHNPFEHTGVQLAKLVARAPEGGDGSMNSSTMVTVSLLISNRHSKTDDAQQPGLYRPIFARCGRFADMGKGARDGAGW